jgi:hypothetical protein
MSYICISKSAIPLANVIKKVDYKFPSWPRPLDDELTHWEYKGKPVHTGLYLVRIGMLRGCDNPFFFL